jgi:HAMP domain-containing protein
MNRLRISTRLFLLIGLLLALMATIGAVTLTGLARNASAIDGMLTHSLLPMRDVAQIQERLLRNRLAIAVALVTPDNPTIDRSLKDIEGNLEAIQKTWQDFTGRELDAKDRELAKAFFDARSRFVEYGLRPTMAALASRDIKDAQRLVVDGVRPLYQPVDAAMQALTDWQIESARQQHAEAISGARVARNVSIGLIVGAVLLSGVLGWLLVRTITSALDRAIDVANRVAAGRLDTPVVAPGRDELSTLLRALESMRANLAKTVGDVRSGAAGGGHGQCPDRAGQRGTCRHALSNRQRRWSRPLRPSSSSRLPCARTPTTPAWPTQMAQGAATVATEGGNAVAQMVESMRSIHDNSRRIAEIISLIDGIALQTNILALNAAVEGCPRG